MSDPWSPTNYTTHASFVPALTERVVSLLDVQSQDQILDLGAGDGLLSVALASRCAHVHATDSSANMVEYTRTRIREGKIANMTAQVVDAGTQLRELIEPGKYNKVFSNAAYHWIFGSLQTAAARQQAFKDVYDVLPTGGEFVVEFGSFGNVAEIMVALSAAVHNVWLKRGVNLTYEEIQATRSPWYFAPLDEVKEWLEKAGFEVVVIEQQFRPTTLTGENGIDGWIETFGFTFWKDLDEAEIKAAIAEGVSLLKPAVWSDYSKTWVVNYVRGRFKAIKK
ncbi:S-adenosyl-L-methionine-dependent methyltransferase [Lipomyces oligophaga]|uniref:S-adenosyl-L-methionine-dependent methyltransferase n=1 Tax=Lipomyces oligophaga TaxID=45792 RepID=UPI0034CF61D6